jgi:hypothetical protein
VPANPYLKSVLEAISDFAPEDAGEPIGPFSPQKRRARCTLPARGVNTGCTYAVSSMDFMIVVCICYNTLVVRLKRFGEDDGHSWVVLPKSPW